MPSFPHTYCHTDTDSQSELLESIDELRARARAEDKAKLEALERQLGVSSGPSTSAAQQGADEDEADVEGSAEGASGSGSGSGSGASATTGSKRIAEIDVAELAAKRHKFDDNKFLEQSREINESVRSAVSAGTLHVLPLYLSYNYIFIQYMGLMSAGEQQARL